MNLPGLFGYPGGMLRLFLSVAALFFAPLVRAQQQDSPIPVLIVTGANNHDWEWTSPSLKAILEESGRFHVDITTNPAQDLAKRDALRDYSAVVLDYNGPRWGAEAETVFLEAVNGGLGVAVIHAANNSFAGWTEYETLVALNWRKGTGHGRFHPFDVVIEDRNHPITRTLPTLTQHPDELYHRLARLNNAAYQRLAGAFSDPKTGGSGDVEPMILLTQVGKGRVFHTPLGHVWRGAIASRASHADPQFRGLVVRGTEWAATGEVSDGYASANQITDEQREAGWRPLFDAKTLDGWQGYRGTDIQGWTVISGCIVRTEPGPDLVSKATFGDFEFEFEFQIAGGTNSGVKYRVNSSGPHAIGPEYQIQDDARVGKVPSKHQNAALYDLLPTTDRTTPTPGTWHAGRIRAHGGVIQHWLDGRLVMSAARGSKAWRSAIAQSKFKSHAESFAQNPGPILLQQHGGEVWYRSLRVRELSPQERREVELLDGEGGLSGWVESGDAMWSRQGNTVTGAVDGKSQSFLRSKQTFADFEFEVDVRLEIPGNSGIQFRSQLSDKGRVYGYQAEIDHTDRAWSGGIYYETGPWLDDLSDDEAAREAFRLDDWNHYRIRCTGPHLQVWVNGIQTADLVDSKHANGFLAFQVHRGQQGKIHWRNPRLWVLE